MKICFIVCDAFNTYFFWSSMMQFYCKQYLFGLYTWDIMIKCMQCACSMEKYLLLIFMKTFTKYRDIVRYIFYRMYVKSMNISVCRWVFEKYFAEDELEWKKFRYKLKPHGLLRDNIIEITVKMTCNDFL